MRSSLSRIPSKENVPLPFNVLVSLVEVSSHDCGRVLVDDPKPFLIPFLKAIGQPALDISTVHIEGDKRDYQQILLTQKLKSGLIALSEADYKALNVIEGDLYNDTYIAFCEEEIALSNYFYLLLSTAELKARKFLDSGGIEIVCHVLSEYEAKLFKMGDTIPEKFGSVQQLTPYAFKVVLNELDLPCPISLPRGVILGAGLEHTILTPKESCRDYLHRVHQAFSGASEYDLAIAPTLPKITPIYSLDGQTKIAICDGLMKKLFNDIIERKDFSAYEVFVEESCVDCDFAYKEASINDTPFLLIAFTHPVYEDEEFHALINNGMLESGDGFFMLRGYKLEGEELLFTEEHHADFGELSLFDMIQIMLSVDTVPTNSFFLD